jgi:hypothetical protein
MSRKLVAIFPQPVQPQKLQKLWPMQSGRIYEIEPEIPYTEADLTGGMLTLEVS